MSEYKGVDTEHPTIVEYVKNAAKQGMSKERAMKIIGMPMEVIDRIYRETEKK